MYGFDAEIRKIFMLFLLKTASYNFCLKIYFVGTHLKHLAEAFLMSITEYVFIEK